jgi:serine/threonine-protein kinase
MTPERFRRVDQLVSLALERAADERAEFIREACAGEEDLRIEVESLLASHENKDGFLAEAPARLAAQLLAESPGHPDNAPTPLPSSELVPGRYKILDKLGVGGMGVVYLAEDPELGRKVAIKLVDPKASGTVSASEGRARLLREARALAQLSHPNVIAVYDVGTCADQVFIAMEYVEGSTLSQWLAEQRRTWQEVLSTFVQAGRGLAAAHAVGIVHRDFKPDNVLVGNDGRIRVLDFGLARPAQSSNTEELRNADAQALADTKTTPRLAILGVTVTQRGKFIGTPAFMAPEQLMGQRVNAKTDQYSFCVALFQGLYDTLPFSADSFDALLEQIRQRKVTEVPNLNSVPSSVHEALLRGLSPNPDDRFASMEALLEKLEWHQFGGAENQEGKRVDQPSPEISKGGSTNWFAELKRRRVFRALVAYGIAAFAALQVIEPVMHRRHWPETVLSYVVAALAAGFPVVISLAWVFDRKGGHIERTAPAAAGTGLRGVRLALSLVGIGALAAAPGLGWYFLFRSDTRIVARKGGEPAGTAERKSVAVLPFVNMSSDKESEYLSDGMTEELINALANVDGLRVASRTSALFFKGKDVDVKKIGERLNVSAVIEGSVRRDGDRLRVTAQLINVADDYHVWSKTYERELKNIFEVEEELASSISQALKAKLVQAEAVPLVRPTTSNLAAHDLYLKGRHLWNKRTGEALTKAIGYFQQAIEQDPSYALAYVGLADATALLHEYGSAYAEEAWPKAKQAALKALELDGTLAEAHDVLCLISYSNFELAAAENECRRAIELKPEYPTAHHRYALVLNATGRVEEALAEAERARQLDPTSLAINALPIAFLTHAREYDRAIEQGEKTLELDPEFWSARWMLASAYIGQGRYAQAVAELKKLRPSTAIPVIYTGFLGYAYAMSGQRVEARRVRADLEERSKREYVSPTAVALICIGLGDKEQAFAWLDRAYAERDVWFLHLQSFSPFDSLRSDPRFTRLLKQMHLQ